ncbi:MAG TPA: nitrate reductase molybdenum cofactor assembly chaperone [Solirubrobacter sp.]|nr:nitrate reductase molybdenum cofactor assembly chaperone [Solirubrobacter sp.]
MSPYKLLSLLLQYPDDELLELWPAIAGAAAAVPAAEVREPLERFFAATAGRGACELQAGYVATFDFDRRASLNLTYYVHGDRRQRGVALLKLKRLFAALALEPATDELPDHLPLLLELADIAGPDAGTAVLREFRPALELIGARLRDQDSPYAELLGALSWLLGPVTEEERASTLRLAADGPPAEEVGLEPFAPPETMSAAR